MGIERLLQRPIYGGIFGHGRYALASMPCVSRGLYSTRYMVVEPQAGAVLSVAEDKVEALAGARRLLKAATELQNPAGNTPPVQAELWPVLPAPLPAPAPLYVSRRRREIFDKSGGCCHYCRGPLQLDGKWHVEHMMPRALGGGDEAVNLVAACVLCNLKKSDRTAIEFVAAGGRGPDGQA
jgi:hypothetical protein